VVQTGKMPVLLDEHSGLWIDRAHVVIPACRLTFGRIAGWKACATLHGGLRRINVSIDHSVPSQFPLPPGGRG
jgi:hypothetical protein